jgi:hypothetical protein
MYWRQLETEEERLKRRAREEAFWNRPADEVMADLTIDEEDLPLPCRGQHHRHFRSPNVIDLVKLRRGKMTG